MEDGEDVVFFHEGECVGIGPSVVFEDFGWGVTDESDDFFLCFVERLQVGFI